MAKYVDLMQISDPSLCVSEQNLLDADVYVDMQLARNGIAQSEITLPNEQLTAIASSWAKRQAAIEGAIGENSPLTDKAKLYEKNAELLAGMITRQALGIPEPEGTAAFGSVTLGRG
jgi:hypothetical protein